MQTGIARALAFVTALSCLGMAALFGTPSALAQDYPTRPVEFVVPYSPSGSTDITARAVADALGRVMKQPVVVVNKPGAGSIIGSQFVANAKPDGYTILVNATAHTVVANKPDLPYDAISAFIPVTRIAGSPYLLVVNSAQFPAKDVKELIAAIKAAPPGSIKFASSGVATSGHLAGELFASMAGVQMTHVPYAGSALTVQAVAAGEVQLTFASPGTQTMAAIEDGQIKALAVSSLNRWDGMPDLASVSEQGLTGFEVEFWSALFLPAGTPAEVVTRLHEAVAEALKDPRLKGIYEKADYSTPLQTPAEFGAFIEADIKKWKEVISAAKIPL
jgi:tripartite-type tricarboxylate transporter receptor subunit TctC